MLNLFSERLTTEKNRSSFFIANKMFSLQLFLLCLISIDVFCVEMESKAIDTDCELAEGEEDKCIVLCILTDAGLEFDVRKYKYSVL